MVTVPTQVFDTSIRLTGDSLSQMELDFLPLINSYRAANGLAPLTLSSDLSVAANRKVLDLLHHYNGAIPSTNGTNYWNHNWSTGDFREGYKALFSRSKYLEIGENATYSYGPYLSPQSALSGWQSSPGHNQNLLSQTWTHIGIAEVGGTWITVFTNEDVKLPVPKNGVEQSVAGVTFTAVAEDIPNLNNDNRVQGLYGNDTLVGNNAVNYMIGMSGDDVLDGRDGDDALYDGAGHDVILGGAGHDTLRIEGVSPAQLSFAVDGKFVRVTSQDGSVTWVNSVETVRAAATGERVTLPTPAPGDAVLVQVGNTAALSTGDVFVGGAAGVQTVTVEGKLADYRLERVGEWVHIQKGTEVDLVRTDVEVLKFADGELRFDLTPMEQAVANIWSMILNRVPDYGTIKWQAGNVLAGHDTTPKIALGLLASAEFSYWTKGFTSDQMAERILKGFFGEGKYTPGQVAGWGDYIDDVQAKMPEVDARQWMVAFLGETQQPGFNDTWADGYWFG